MTQSLDELVEDLKLNLAEYEIEEFCDKLRGENSSGLIANINEITNHLSSVEDGIDDIESALDMLKADISELPSMLKKYTA